jgi:TolB-like protein/DNA-binding winged helix-turn-helix (wHTH) protein
MDFAAGFKLGQYEVRPEDNMISGPSGETRIEPKSMDVLVELAKAGGRTVSRDQIVEVVWPRGFVSDDALTRCVAQIRKALDDSTKSPDFLVTIRKRGYKLIRLVEPLVLPRAQGLAAAPGILVLPLQSLSKNSEDAYIADGLTELITASLAGMSGLRVISRTTAMGLKGSDAPLSDMAAKVGAPWIVEGSVVIAGSNARVVIQLIDASQASHVLAETYSSTVDELLDLQIEIADRVSAIVSEALGVSIVQPDRPAIELSEAGLREYLRGRSLQSKRTSEDLAEAAACFERVISDSLTFADARASLAESLMMRAHYGVQPVAEVRTDINDSLNKALALEPDNAIALYCRGATRLFFDREISSAEEDMRRALSAQASNPMAALCMANICAVRKNFEGAIAWMKQALLINSLDVGLNMNLGDHLLLQGRYDQATAQFEKTLEIDAEHWPSQLRLAWALALDGSQDGAMYWLDIAARQIKSTASFHEYAAMVGAAAGLRQYAADHYESIESRAKDEFIAPWSKARAAAAAGDFDAAFEHLDNAVEQNSSSLLFFHLTPAFRSLREDNRARHLAKRILPD